ncbi:5'-nucleotidase, partial [Prunus dulcis]
MGLGFVAVVSETRPTWKAMLLVRRLWVIADFDGTLTKYRVNGCRDKGGLTYDGIRQSVADSTIAFREGVVELFEFLEWKTEKNLFSLSYSITVSLYPHLQERDIPILIFSAGLADIIEEVLRQKIHRLFKNVKIVSNRMIFDNNGHLVSFQVSRLTIWSYMPLTTMRSILDNAV